MLFLKVLILHLKNHFGDQQEEGQIHGWIMQSSNWNMFLFPETQFT